MTKMKRPREISPHQVHDQYVCYTVLLKDHLKEIFTAENFGRMLERIDNVDEIMARGEKKGMKKGRAEGREEARALTIGTFLLKMPDMPDEDVASLFDVTVEYVKALREKMKTE